MVVTYNRPSSLERLLKALKNSYYGNDNVDLIISIDKSDKEKVVKEIADNYNWNVGNKYVRTFKERQGLRNHILKCGDLTNSYEAVIIFEDDIVPAENFYKFSKEALNYYKNDSKIAGISLYSPLINEMAEKPFAPMQDHSDVYFIQSAQSWGQCWSKEMWNDFRSWYENNNTLKTGYDMPSKIYSWPETSWKKFYMKYIVETNKFFVYPYISLSTNASEIGEHAKQQSNMYQVPLLHGIKDYKFTDFENGIKYDVFFENMEIGECYLGINNSNLCVDLYGTKNHNFYKRYVLTKKRMNYNVIKRYSLSFKPHDVNIIFDETGDDIYLYDLGEEVPTIIKGKIDIKKDLDFNSVLPWKYSLIKGILNFKEYIIRRMFKHEK
ncbi:glycosyltransferase [Alkalibacillus almallahensis]|uniref:glycosyltransferase n=1 Tax=Alkalibacillus almallahensis TaxID=1379154 RepID=UPI0014243A38